VTLDEAAVDRAAQLLYAARRARTVIPGLPADVAPRDLDDAYAISDRLAERIGDDVAGWYCACTNPEIQALLGLREPYRARIFAHALHASPATLRAADFPPIVLECEVAFRLGRDLPPRPTPYTRDEVADAVASVHGSIEVVAGHLADWPRQDVFAVIADNGTDGALVVGQGTADWRDVDLPGLAVSLAVDGVTVESGSGANVLGDPLTAFAWLANERAAARDGLRAGHTCNTGTATPMHAVAAPCTAVADFGPLGTVRLTLR
jgi:2-keto-4-pentenoate hydratase